MKPLTLKQVVDSIYTKSGMSPASGFAEGIVKKMILNGNLIKTNGGWIEKT
jgi:hypothetical protein